MKTTARSTRRTDGLWFGVGVLAMLCTAAPPLHAEMSAATIPSTNAHYFSSHPMIAGTVVTVNDHQLVVDTEQGERITLEMDSRTLTPRDLAPGMPVRTEFAALENCRFRADRIFPVRAGTSMQRLQAYANTNASGTHVASNNPSYRHASVQGPGRTRYASTAVRTTPGTSDHYYSTHPLIAGTALSVNDHRIVVETDQGRRVAMVMDSRTSAPRELAPGSLLRAEFKRMQDGRFYAQRIHVVGEGDLLRVQAYANTVDNDIASAGIIGDCESVTRSPGNSATATVASYQGNGRYGNGSVSDAGSGRNGGAGNGSSSTDPNSASYRNGAGNSDGSGASANGQDSRTGTLPQTASPGPLYLLLGLIAVGAAGVITYLRPRSS